MLVILVIVGAAACSGGASARPVPTPGPTPGPVPTLPQLKLTLIGAYGRLWYCDPDFYPIARQDEIDAARERWVEVVADAEAFAALTSRLGMDPGGAFTNEQKLEVYRAWKVLNAIALDPIGNDTYRFDYLAQPFGNAAEGTRTAGAIDTAGTITVEQQVPAGEPMCPICLAAGTGIDTPAGRVAVELLRIGDPVWTLDGRGDRVPGTVIAVGSTVAPAAHQVVRLVLADGRTATASPGHPLADGQQLGGLAVGDDVDGAAVVIVELIAYDGEATYDIDVSGPTGIYFIDGIPLGSTLRP
jgi:hypothetical protein